MIQPTLPLSIQTMVIQYKGVTIYYPQVIGLADLTVQHLINKQIFHVVQTLWQGQYEQQKAAGFQEMIGTFEVKTNERHVLSLVFTNYAYAPYHAHGLTLVQSLNLDVTTGKNYILHELFKPGSDYKKMLTKMVQQQVKDRNIDVFDEQAITVSRNQDYYVADKSFVLFYQLYDITPHYVGIPMFPISVYTVQNNLEVGTPLQKMVRSL